VVTPRDAAVQGAAGAFGGAVDGDIEVGFGVIDGDAPFRRTSMPQRLPIPPLGPLTSESRTTMRETMSRP
jgi:hypothetical protein